MKSQKKYSSEQMIYLLTHLVIQETEDYLKYLKKFYGELS